MTLDACITDSTRITGIKPYEKNMAFSLDGRKVYFKEFDVNELIGEELAKVRNLRANSYFLTLVGEKMEDFRFNTLDPRTVGKITLGSYDFEQKGYRYFQTVQFGLNDNCFFELLDMCPSKTNRDELTNEILELFALDTFMAQEDRMFYNVLFEVDDFFNIHLAKIYDFELAFQTIDANDIYLNDLYSFLSDAHYKLMMDKFPQFYEMLKSYLEVDLVEKIKSVFEAKELDYSNLNFRYYTHFEDCKKIQLERILR